MDTIDFQQLVLNLMGRLPCSDIIKQTGLTEHDISNINNTFQAIQNLLDLHLEVCPDLHNKEQLIIKM